MSENKVKLSLTLSADNRTQMQALANFALTLAGAETVEMPTHTEAPVVLYGTQTRSNSETVSLSTFKPDPATVSTTNAEPTEEDKPKRRRRTAAEMKADNSAESEPAEAAESEAAEVDNQAAEEEPEAAPKPSKITLDDVRRAVAEKKDLHLQIMKFKLKEDFGVTKTPDLAEHQYEAFYNFLQSLD
jgi:hypothetical protein